MNPLFDVVIFDLIKVDMDMCTDTVTADVVASPMDVELGYRLTQAAPERERRPGTAPAVLHIHSSVVSLYSSWYCSGCGKQLREVGLDVVIAWACPYTRLSSSLSLV